ncbi:alpha/beta fold hydrolase [Leptolyngbya sp. FACHB-261]|nr:alpha/beta fold hydrolase [Leptolyngbya sp. FACHB-261]
MPQPRWLLLLLSLLLIALSWWGLLAARTGLNVRSLEHDGVPMLYLALQQASQAPGVLIAHGYAGSKQLMLGYGYTLARSGYAVMLWDFDGHGANTAALERLSLQRNLDTAYAALLEQPEVDPKRLALLGHSMGSGAVMSAAIQDPARFAATVAISPTGAAVTPETPRNLMLQAGSWEQGFVANAQRLLAAAGGENNDLAGGRGRTFVLIPKAEHITILLRPISHQAALNWLDQTFNLLRSAQATMQPYIDRRFLWYGLHLLAWLLCLSALAPTLTAIVPESKVTSSRLRRWGGLLLSPLLAGGALLLLSRSIQLESLGGVQVGGAVGLWFLVAGLVWLASLFRLPRPTLPALGVGAVLFGLLWLAFGVMAQEVWLQWWLLAGRLRLWPLLAVACVPWFLASGLAQRHAGGAERLLWWLAQSVVLVVGFGWLTQLLPQLGFIYLLLPLFPLLMAMFVWIAALLRDAWSYALGSALFFGWVLAAVFPLAS